MPKSMELAAFSHSSSRMIKYPNNTGYKKKDSRYTNIAVNLLPSVRMDVTTLRSHAGQLCAL